MKRVHSGGDDDDAQEPIEAGKMVHMGVRYESVADAQELAGESGVRSRRSNSNARRPKRKLMNSPGSENGSLTRLGWTSQVIVH